MVDKSLIYKFHDLFINEMNKEVSDIDSIINNLKDIIDIKDDKLCEKEICLIKKQLLEDLDYFMICDPAVTSKEEVIVTYPGFFAIQSYRIANLIRKYNNPIAARIISERAHTLTGIDIHPGASIESPFFIDHGTGIVIGETCIIGKRVRLYQGVTLGALSLGKGALLKGTKRHPTVKNDVIIYSGASILGDITINDDVTIGSNVFLLDSVEAHMKVILQKPELIYKTK